MDIKKLKKYLEDLLKLESEKYRLEEIKNAILNDKRDKQTKINLSNTEVNRIIEEKEQNINKLKSDIENKKNEINSLKFNGQESIIWFFVFFVSFIGLMIIKSIFDIEDGSIGVHILIIISIVIPSVFVYKMKKPYKERRIKLQKEVYELEASFDDKKKSLDEDCKKMIAKSELHFDEYKKNLSILCENDENNLKDLEKIYEEILNKLSELYEVNIIFEKYRNLAAITMFYEYFSSSRVFELEGKDGAYNLYESELRQNLIINNLNKINDNLEQIKDNQYCMYNELKNVNSSLNIINKNLIDGLSDITMIQMANLAVNREISKNIKTIKSIQVHDFIMN